MKLTSKYLIPVLLLLPACQLEEDTQEPNDLVPSGPVNIIVSIDEETRATVAEATGAMAFSNGDAIKIYNGAGIYSGITFSADSKGTFVMDEGFVASGNGYAGFPASLVSNITSSGVTFVLPDTYEFSQVGGTDANTAKVTCPMIGTYTGGNYLSLKHAGAVARFYITNVMEGVLIISFPTYITGTVTVSTPTGTGDGILASKLSNPGRAVKINGVPATSQGEYLCITLPVPTGTVPDEIRVVNRSSASLTLGQAIAVVSDEPLSRSAGERIVVPDFSYVTIETVDMGTGVKWANMNLGATSVSDIGYYLAWGEPTPKHTYTWSTYRWGFRTALSKYNESDGKTQLELCDDPAYFTWGEGWRLPTSAELLALDGLPSTWVEDYNGSGMPGRIFTASNGNSIFLPAAFAKTGAPLFDNNCGGYYWSSSIYLENNRSQAHILSFTSNNSGVSSSGTRFYGFYARPVYQEPGPALASVSISPESVTLWTGETQQLTATVLDADSNPVTDANVVWSVVEGTSATVSESGLVTATTTPGITTIRATASYGGVSKTADCTVTVKMLTSVTVDGLTSVIQGSTTTLSATAFDNASTELSDATITWASRDPSVAVVDATTGVVTGVAAGTARIYCTAQYGNRTVTSSNFSVTVVAPKIFSVAAGSGSGSGKRVYFSPGNLQYCAVGTHSVSGGGTEQGVFRFAEHQYDFVGGSYNKNSPNPNGTVYKDGVRCDNAMISSSYDGWIDLFGWATSGYNGKYAYQDTDYNTSDQYGPSGISAGEDWTAYSNEWDWGYHNAIVNGSTTDAARTWRVLTSAEWDYLINTRSASTVNGVANARYTKAYLFGSIHGLILFPDTYSHPAGVAAPTGINEAETTSGWDGNQYSAEDWAKMEVAGCIFLPTTGMRYEGESISLYDSGYYWSSTAVALSWEPEPTDHLDASGGLFFTYNQVRPNTQFRFRGDAVRLVRNALGPLTSVTVDGLTSVIQGSTTTLTATAFDNASTELSDATITWASRDPSVAVVDATTGVVTGVAAGTARIYCTAQYGNRTVTSSNFSVTVVAPKIFRVAAGSGSGKRVYFSPGNLQYCAVGTHSVSGGGTEQGVFRFAEHQYDFVGDDRTGNVNANGVKCDNALTSSSYSGWIDLFGWGTSGYDNYYPYLRSTSNLDYHPLIESGEMSSDSPEWDWGYHNAIVNGSSVDPARTWRTMSEDEWMYVLNTRSASTVNGVANARYARAKLFGSILGIILFPDTYTHPSGVALPTYINDNSDIEDIMSSVNRYSAEDWAKMETAGCVFLPAAGYRDDRYTDYGIIGLVNYAGSYMTSTAHLSTYWTGAQKYGYYRVFYSDSHVQPNNDEELNINAAWFFYGSSVRLVKNVN